MDHAKYLFYAQKSLQTLFSLTNKLQRQGDRHLQDITIRQMLAIPAIVHAPDGQASFNHIARQLETTKQNAKQLVQALEKKDYLTVGASSHDKRAVNVTITAAGEQAFKVCSERTGAFLKTVFADFTDAELEVLYTLLEKLYRYDGTAPTGGLPHAVYDPGNAEAILQQHPEFGEQADEIK